MTVFYAQTDPRWAKERLGYNADYGFTIGAFGCLVTAVGNLLVAASGNEGYTPEYINEWMKRNAGFVPGGGIMYWQKVQAMGHVTAVATGQPLHDFLAPAPNFAILEVRAGKLQHFVLANTQSTIIDSEDGRQKPLNTYPIVAVHQFVATDIPAAPVAPVGPQVTPVDVMATVNVPLLNTRGWVSGSETGPSTACPLGPQLRRGTFHVNGWVVGQEVTVGGRTNNVWLLTDGGHWAAQAGTTLNE